MSKEKNLRLHHAPIKKFTSFFLYPFYSDNAIKPTGKWSQPPFEIPETMDKLKNKWGLQKNYAEYIYFHDFVRAFLFPKAPKLDEGNQDKNIEENIVQFYRHQLTDAIVSIESLEGKEISAILAGIYLYRFPNKIWILVIETSNTKDDEEGDEVKNENTNDSLISRGDQLLLFNNMFRRVYPSFFEKDNPLAQMKTNEFPKKVSIVSDDFSFSETYSLDTVYLKPIPSSQGADGERHYPVFKSPITALLGSFFNLNEEKKMYPILDDRMLVHSYVAFQSDVKDMVTLDQDDIFFSHFMYIDNPDFGYRYNKSFILNLMQKHEYTRWTHWRTRMGFTRYSSMFMFFDHIGYVYRPFISMYFQMFLLITYYRASLIRFSNEIAEIAKDFQTENKDIPKKLKTDLRDLHTRFMKFMNVHWFTEVSNQDQGIELFQKMRDAFEIEPMYDQVKDEIERADELVELIHQQKIERFQDSAGKIGLTFAFLAVITGFLGMNFTEVEYLRNNFWNDFNVFKAISVTVVGPMVVIFMWICFKIIKKVFHSD
jgi:hypothetical protein